MIRWIRKLAFRLRGLIALLLQGRAPINALLLPVAGIEARAAGGWRSRSNDPQFELRFPKYLPRGATRVVLRIDSPQGGMCAKLYFDCGEGYTETRAESWDLRSGQTLRTRIYLPLQLRRLRFDPCEVECEIDATSVQVACEGFRASLAWAMRDRARRWFGGRLSPRLRRWLGLEAAPDYLRFLAQTEPALEDVRLAVLAHIERMVEPPRFSVLMPAWNTPAAWLDRAVESVRAQVYPHWELCVVDDGSTRNDVADRLRAWSARDARVRFERAAVSGGISAATNRALSMAGGDWVTFLDHDDELAPLALYHFAAEILGDPGLEMLYADEDKLDARGSRFQPHFKTGWNPELLAAQNYITHPVAYRRARVLALGGLRSECDGSQDHDLALRISADLAPAQIRHVPVVLYHWRAVDGSTAQARSEKSYAHDAGLRALRSRFASEPGTTVESGPLPLTYRVRYPLPDPVPRVAIMVPTRDGYRHLHRCVEGLLARTEYPAYEVLIVDNQSRDPQTLDWMTRIARDRRVRLLRYDAPFNYSAINNFAVAQTDADVIVLLNDDTDVISPGWLREMIALATRPDVGAVGAKLYYPDDTLQHAGVGLGIGGVAGHTHWRFPRDAHGYMGRLHLCQAVSAVTAACLAIERAKFLAVGGLDEERLKIAFNDVDLCLKLAARGWRAVWTPYAELYHHESISRGAEDSPDKRARFKAECDCMRARWAAELDHDPYYHRCFSRTAQDYSLEPLPVPYRPWEWTD